jgi:2-polyprenyl-3-methyl-5-hydroxy-6-metoxy-1,4-benzoquinol methylase
MGTMTYQYQDSVRGSILRMIPQDGERIGSIGCGTGATEAKLIEAGRKVYGVDISAEAIEIAKQRLTSARVVKSDDLALFEEGSLDGLILADVLEHIPAAWHALALYTKMVKVGGWVVISVPNMRSLLVVSKFFLGGDWPEDQTGIFDKTHVQVMSPRRLDRWCSAAGLKTEKRFDRYLSIGWKQALLKAIDIATFRLLRGWFTFQVQIRCRRIR